MKDKKLERKIYQSLKEKLEKTNIYEKLKQFSNTPREERKVRQKLNEDIEKILVKGTRKVLLELVGDENKIAESSPIWINEYASLTDVNYVFEYNSKYYEVGIVLLSQDIAVKIWEAGEFWVKMCLYGEGKLTKEEYEEAERKYREEIKANLL